MLNKVMFIGNTGAAPEIRQANNDKVANFNIASTETWKDKNGNKQEKTTWMPVVAWGGLATLCEKYVGKGKQLYVEGKLNVRKYTDNAGAERFVTEIIADEIKLLGKKDGE